VPSNTDADVPSNTDADVPSNADAKHNYLTCDWFL